MKVQFAVDCMSMAEGISLMTKIQDYVDIIELGDVFVSRYGHLAIREFKGLFPDKKILADIKIMDSGYKLALPCLEAGADIVTVCARAKEKTISEAIRACRETGKECMVDMVAVEDYAECAKMIRRLKPDYVCGHLSGDDSRDGDEKTTERLEALIADINKIGFGCKLVLSGAIKTWNIDVVKAAHPYHIIVGRAIKEAQDPVAVAKAFYEA